MPIDIISPFESLLPPSLPVGVCVSRPLLSSLMATGGEKGKKKKNLEAMFPKTATQRQHLLRLDNS